MAVNFKILGKRIREVRKQAGLSQAQLAEMANLSAQYLSQIENAKKKASLQSLLNISNALNVSLDMLLNGNQRNHFTEYKSEIDFIMKDCTCFEKRVIFELIHAVKSILKDNISLVEFDKE